jgi:hypothetical protein
MFSRLGLVASVPAPELQVRANSKLNQYSNPYWYIPSPPLPLDPLALSISPVLINTGNANR